MKYSDPNHPEHLTWMIGRRKRFCKILREGKRVVKLSHDEKALVVAACALIEKNTKAIEK